MWVALAINVALLAATVVGGILTDSLALLADAGHLLSDVGAIAIGAGGRAARRAWRRRPRAPSGFSAARSLGALVERRRCWSWSRC